MNAERRANIQSIVNELNDLKDRISEVLDEESEYKDNIPENLQSGERYEKAEAAVDNLDSAMAAVDECVDYLESATA